MIILYLIIPFGFLKLGQGIGQLRVIWRNAVPLMCPFHKVYALSHDRFHKDDTWNPRPPCRFGLLNDTVQIVEAVSIALQNVPSKRGPLRSEV